MQAKKITGYTKIGKIIIGDHVFVGANATVLPNVTNGDDSQKYFFKPVNQCFCLVDYQENGMSANIYRQYINSPRSFAELRRVLLKTPSLTQLYHLKTAIHYVSSCILAKDCQFITKSPAKLLTILAIPFGIALSFYIRYKAR